MIRVSTVPDKAALQSLALKVTIEATVEEWQAIVVSLSNTLSFNHAGQTFQSHISAAISDLTRALTQFSAERGS